MFMAACNSSISSSLKKMRSRVSSRGALAPSPQREHQPIRRPDTRKRRSLALTEQPILLKQGEGDLTFEPAPYPLDSDLSPEARLVGRTASTADDSLLHRGEDVSQRNGTDTNHSDKDKEQQYLHEIPSHFCRSVITNATSLGNRLEFAARLMGVPDLCSPICGIGI